MRTISLATRASGVVVEKSQVSRRARPSPTSSATRLRKAPTTLAHSSAVDGTMREVTVSRSRPWWRTSRGRSSSACRRTCSAAPWAMVSQMASGDSARGRCSANATCTAASRGWIAGVSMTGRSGAPSAIWCPTRSASGRAGRNDPAGVTSSTAKVIAMGGILAGRRPTRGTVGWPAHVGATPAQQCPGSCRADTGCPARAHDGVCWQPDPRWNTSARGRRGGCSGRGPDLRQQGQQIKVVTDLANLSVVEADDLDGRDVDASASRG
jgi:hypothetical protein